MTGRYPHHNGATGFYPVSAGVPTMAELLKSGGYYLGTLGKMLHLQPPEKSGMADIFYSLVKSSTNFRSPLRIATTPLPKSPWMNGLS